MSDTFLASLFIGLLAAIFAWILLLQAISRRLRERHPGRCAAVFGTPGRRKNGMDKFFGLLGFLLGEDHATLGDRALFLNCVLLKICTALVVGAFLAMMFGPFFLRTH